MKANKRPESPRKILKAIKSGQYTFRSVRIDEQLQLEQIKTKGDFALKSINLGNGLSLRNFEIGGDLVIDGMIIQSGNLILDEGWIGGSLKISGLSATKGSLNLGEVEVDGHLYFERTNARSLDMRHCLVRGGHVYLTDIELTEECNLFFCIFSDGWVDLAGVAAPRINIGQVQFNRLMVPEDDGWLINGCFTITREES